MGPAVAAMQLFPLLVQMLSAAPGMMRMIREASDAIARAHAEGRDLTRQDWDRVHAVRIEMENELARVSAPRPAGT